MPKYEPGIRLKPDQQTFRIHWNIDRFETHAFLPFTLEISYMFRGYLLKITVILQTVWTLTSVHMLKSSYIAFLTGVYTQSCKLKSQTMNKCILFVTVHNRCCGPIFVFFKHLLVKVAADSDSWKVPLLLYPDSFHLLLFLHYHQLKLSKQLVSYR